MNHQRDVLAQVLLDSFGGRFYMSRSRALQHADAVLRAGFWRPHLLTSPAELAALADGAVVQRSRPAERPEIFVRHQGAWVSIDGGVPIADGGLFVPGTWLTLVRT